MARTRNTAQAEATDAADTPEAPAPRSAAELAAHLKATYSPPRVVAEMEAWAKSHPEASAADAYAQLERGGAKVGTLAKAGKFAFGDDFAPETAGKAAPADELAALRAENERHRRRIGQLEADLAGTKRREALLQDQLNSRTSQLQLVNAGRLVEIEQSA